MNKIGMLDFPVKFCQVQEAHVVVTPALNGIPWDNGVVVSNF